VIGFDDINEVIVQHDGLNPDRVVSYAKFNKAWARAGSWMLVITPQSGDSQP
jgi:hypothetical protein